MNKRLNFNKIFITMDNIKADSYYNRFLHMYLLTQNINQREQLKRFI